METLNPRVDTNWTLQPNRRQRVPTSSMDRLTAHATLYVSSTSPARPSIECWKIEWMSYKNLFLFGPRESKLSSYPLLLQLIRHSVWQLPGWSTSESNKTSFGTLDHRCTLRRWRWSCSDDAMAKSSYGHTNTEAVVRKLQGRQERRIRRVSIWIGLPNIFEWNKNFTRRMYWRFKINYCNRNFY